MIALIKDNFLALICMISMFFYCVVFNNTSGWNLFFIMCPLFIHAFIVTSFKGIINLKSTHIETHTEESIKVEVDIETTPLNLMHSYYATLNINGKIITSHSFVKADSTYHFSFDNNLARGRYNDVKVAIFKKDLFSLIRRKHLDFKNVQVDVLPRLVQEIDGDFMEIINLISQSKSLFAEQTSHEIRDLKEYEIGMPVKNIHWKALSKSGEIVVKNFETSRQDQPALIFMPEHSANFEQALSVFYTLAIHNSSLFSDIKILEDSIAPSSDKHRFLNLVSQDTKFHDIPSMSVVVTPELVRSSTGPMIQLLVSDNEIQLLDGEGLLINTTIRLRENTHD